MSLQNLDNYLVRRIIREMIRQGALRSLIQWMCTNTQYRQLGQPMIDRITTITLYYANRCPYSQQLFPIWTRLCDQNRHYWLGFQQSEERTLPRNNTILFFPTIRKVKQGHEVEYHGDRTLDNLISFIYTNRLDQPPIVLGTLSELTPLPESDQDLGR